MRNAKKRGNEGESEGVMRKEKMQNEKRETRPVYLFASNQSMRCSIERESFLLSFFPWTKTIHVVEDTQPTIRRKSKRRNQCYLHYPFNRPLSILVSFKSSSEELIRPNRCCAILHCPPFSFLPSYPRLFLPSNTTLLIQHSRPQTFLPGRTIEQQQTRRLVHVFLFSREGKKAFFFLNII